MTSIRLTTPDKLTADEWKLWLDIQQSSPAYESPYFRPEFTQAVAAVRSDVEIAVFEEAGQPLGFLPFQRGKLGMGKPVGGKLSDYHGPLLRQGVQFDPREMVRQCGLATWDFDHLVGPIDAFQPYITLREGSPQIDVSAGYEAYVRARREAGSDSLVRTGQKARKLAREIGPLSFEHDCNAEEAFQTLRQWKSEQYARTGLADVFSFPWTLELITRLREHCGEEFSAPLSVLRSGNKLAAIALSLRSRGLLHVWFNAYNPELANYSPGLVFFVQLAEMAEKLGIKKIDLGRGSERYKTSLASGAVELCEGTVDCPTLTTWLRSGWRQSRDWVNRSPLRGAAKFPGQLLRPIRHWLAYH